jgi:hypothetical protein
MGRVLFKTGNIISYKTQRYFVNTFLSCLRLCGLIKGKALIPF